MTNPAPSTALKLASHDFAAIRREVTEMSGRCANAYLEAAVVALLDERDRLRLALKGLADDVEKVARDSFSTCDGNFDDDFRIEDPTGYAVWNAARRALEGSHE